jgi:hypothetical protein
MKGSPRPRPKPKNRPKSSDVCYEPFPEPPEGPPSRTFKETFFSGLVETAESKQRTRDWENYMRGYGQGLASRRVHPTQADGVQCGNPNIDMPARKFADVVNPKLPPVVFYTTLKEMIDNGDITT